MKNKLVFAKNIFCIITVVWSSIMSAEYISVLLPFNLKGVLLEIFDFFLIFLYLGIWCVPVLFLVSLILLAWVREKYKDYGKYKVLDAATIVVPVFIAVLMLLTGFNSRLQ